jgi:hypothetical protein
MTDKKSKWSKTWVNITVLGHEFGLPAAAMGKKLVEVGLRYAMSPAAPTNNAFDDGFAIAAPMKNGTPNYLWNRPKTVSFLAERGLEPKSREEVRRHTLDFEAKKIAREIKQLEKNREDRLVLIYWDSVRNDSKELTRMVTKYLE